MGLKLVGSKRARRKTSPAAPRSLPAALRGKWAAYVQAITAATKRAPGLGVLDALRVYLVLDAKISREREPKPGDLQRHYRLQLALGLLSPIAAPTTSSRSDDDAPPSIPRRGLRTTNHETIFVPPRGKFDSNVIFKMQRQIRTELDPDRRAALELALGRFVAQPQAVNDD